MSIWLWTIKKSSRRWKTKVSWVYKKLIYNTKIGFLNFYCLPQVIPWNKNFLNFLFYRLWKCLKFYEYKRIAYYKKVLEFLLLSASGCVRLLHYHYCYSPYSICFEGFSYELLLILQNSGISLSNCRKRFRDYVVSVLLYGSETWPRSTVDLLHMKSSDHAIIRCKCGAKI